MSPIRVILEKEWADLIRNRLLVISMAIPSLLFLLLPFLITFLVPLLEGAPGSSDRNVQQMLENLLSHSPELKGLESTVLFQIYMYRQFLVLLLLIPVMGGLSIATFSIIGEKQARSLEPLLATPITTSQLLLGKSLSAALPSVALTWTIFGLYVLGMWVIGPAEVLHNVVTPVGLTLVFLIGPLIATLGLSLGVAVSSRSNDPRTAQQIGVVAILPLMALFISQLRGFFILQIQWIFVGATILAVIDFVILRIGIALFQRETILTRWK
jgi:ABC-2 type transport system permease protein